MISRKELKDYVKSKLVTQLITAQKHTDAFGHERNDIHINPVGNGGMRITMVERAQGCIHRYILNVMYSGAISWRVIVDYPPCWECMASMPQFKQDQYKPLCLVLSSANTEYPDDLPERIVKTILASYRFYHAKYNPYEVVDNGESQTNN